ncbi:MAG: bifunctional glucose-6-phosphate/mannose-6-phosphate isomerase-like protein [Actinomycetia bacterium]|jgi:D-arabinose 5-phosphate isomerase GutQ|nr:bifunctional glucose-6-phosphate/mannose-6-phosphate isomerase-like protein [Actinomycetes bacterium]
MDIDEYRLDDPEVLGDPDAASMLRSVAGAGAQVREAAALAAEAGLHTLAEDGRPRALVVAGVGTAARTGDVLAAVAGSGCPVPVLSHRSAIVPGWVGAADMVIAVSASGKSPEALAAAEAAMQRGARLVAVGAADSPLQSMAERARAIFVPVPPRRPARVSFWALVVPVLLAGRAVGLANVTEADFAETAKRLDDDAERCRPVGEVFVNSGKALAVELAGSIPVVWGTNRLSSVAASRFADSLAANARYPAIAGALVEAGRGRVGLLDGPFGSMAGGADDFFADRSDDSKDTRLRLVLLRDDDEAPIAARRAEAVADLAAARGVGVSVLTAEGGCELERLASLIAIPDFASVYLALLHGIDPIAVPAVTDLKERIAP